MKPGDQFIEVDSKSGYLVRYEMTNSRAWAACPIRFTAVAGGKTIEEARINMTEAIQLYLGGRRESGGKIADPESQLEERHLECERFDKAMGKILPASKEELDRRLAALKETKTEKRYPEEG